ncbi:MAG TPA: hypothetical protein VNZ49_04030 [Bacteroidia bacterium]|jgi:hypothetical protein|nr:hypothetical protein [Bacteroidia bacterium]
MGGKTLNILIADTDDLFRNKLKEILYEVEIHNTFYNFNVMCPASVEEIKLVFESDKIDLAFIDSAFFTEKDKAKVDEFKKINMNCHLVMLIPDEASNSVYEIIEHMGKQKSYQLSGHILKDNYSREMVRVMVEIFINKL